MSFGPTSLILANERYNKLVNDQNLRREVADAIARFIDKEFTPFRNSVEVRSLHTKNQFVNIDQRFNTIKKMQNATDEHIITLLKVAAGDKTDLKAFMEAEKKFMQL